MKVMEINLLEKQRELEKKRDEAKKWYDNCLVATFGFFLMGIIAYFGIPYITEEKVMLEQGRVVLLVLCLVLSAIFLIFMFNYNKSYKKTEQEIKKIKGELGE